MSSILATSDVSGKCSSEQQAVIHEWQREAPKPVPVLPPPIERSLLWLPGGGLVHLDWSNSERCWETFCVHKALLKPSGESLDDAERAAIPALIGAVERQLEQLRAYVAAQEVPNA